MRPRAPKFLLLCFLSGLLAACSQPETEEELLARASTALEAGRIEAATVDIKTALQQNPESSDARVLLGRTYLHQRDPAAAAEEFQRALEGGNDPDIQVLYAQARVAAGDTGSLLAAQRGANPPGAERAGYNAAVARAYAISGDFDAAQASLDRAEAQDADDPYVRVSEALVLLRQGDRRFDAAEILARVTEDHPGNDEAWSVRAEVARLDRDFASAAEWYTKAVELNPYRLSDRLQLVGVLLELDRDEEADRRLSALEKLMPDNPGVNFARGRMLVEAGEYEAALQELSRVLTVLPEHGPTLYLAAMANAQEGNMATALRQLTKYARDNPRNVQARLQLATLHLREGNAAAAETAARELLQENDMNIPAKRLLALALATQGLYAESAQLYQEISAVEPGSAQDLAGLGASRLLSGETELGVRELEKALELEPANTALRERLISVYIAAGDFEAARQAVAAYPVAEGDDVARKVLSGRVALQSGNRDEARRLFTEVVALEPGNIGANSGLAAIAFAESDLAAARERFTAIATAHPEHVPTWMNLAVLEEQAGNMPAMVTALEKAVAADATALRPRLALARYRLNAGQTQDAIRLLNAVREQHAQDYDLQQTLALAHLAAGDRQSAVAAADALLALRPQDPSTLGRVARIKQRAGEAAQAQQHAEKALSLAPDNPEFRKLLIEALLNQNELDSAAAELSRLPAAVREEPGVALTEGRVAMFQDRHADAEAAFQRAFNASPDTRSLLLLAAAQWAQDKRDVAINGFERWLAENPDDNAVRNELATRQLFLGNEEEARAHYEILLEAAPENPMVLNNLAWLNREVAMNKALAYAARANEIAPGNPQILDTYAMLFHADGKLERALELSKQAVAADDAGADVRLNRAIILADAGRRDAARELLEQLVAGEPFAGQKKAAELLDGLR
jgi:putative PEP-CTERM system TPR-repeat lipoprotein